MEFVCNGVSYEYDIDARTGAILEVETEPDD
ncbi:MAG: PepSY domain-containing protein [Oscillibacter sp.]|nr:PepSY domain-containing protein [Oscillibacter sp.]